MMDTTAMLLDKKTTACQTGESTDVITQVGSKQVKVDNMLENELADSGMNVRLTDREKEIFELILAGNTNKEIAQKLYRTERTVEYHRNRLMRKLGTHNIVELVKYAIAMGIA